MLGVPKLIIYANLIPFIVLVFLLVMISYNPTHSKNQTRIFQIAAILNIFMILIVSLDYMFSGSISFENIALRRITSAIKFSCSPLIPILLYKVFLAKKTNKLFYVPVLANAILCFSSIFNGVVFYISNTNDYERGNLFFIPFLITMCYLVLILFQRNYRYRHNKQVERLFLLFVVGFLCLGLFLEMVYTYHFLTWDISAVCLFAYYLLLCIHNAILDPLTGAFNRIHYMKTLANYEYRKTFTMAMIDLNNFKDINDQYGHDAGDKVLIYFVTLLEKHIGSSAIVYRIGGDEFILLARKASISQLDNLIQTVQQEANENSIKFAYGLDTYCIDEEVQEVVTRADQKMYEHKKRCKQS